MPTQIRPPCLYCTDGKIHTAKVTELTFQGSRRPNNSPYAVLDFTGFIGHHANENVIDIAEVQMGGGPRFNRRYFRPLSEMGKGRKGSLHIHELDFSIRLQVPEHDLIDVGDMGFFVFYGGKDRGRNLWLPYKIHRSSHDEFSVTHPLE